MWKRSLAFIFGLSLFFYLSSAFAGICSANRVYEISETELTMLQNHLDALESNNETLKAILTTSDESLTVALDALMQSQKELTELRTQLERAKTEAESARKSLEIANSELAKASESFKASEREHDKIEGRLRTQRNIWEALFAVAVGVAVAR